jgi:hypothetical protein
MLTAQVLEDMGKRLKIGYATSDAHLIQNTGRISRRKQDIWEKIFHTNRLQNVKL